MHHKSTWRNYLGSLFKDQVYWSNLQNIDFLLANDKMKVALHIAFSASLKAKQSKMYFDPYHAIDCYEDNWVTYIWYNYAGTVRILFSLLIF